MKKIMFNDRYGLTQTVLDGRKTMTRRLVSDKLWDKWTEYDNLCSSVGVGGLAELGVAVTREYSDYEKFFLDHAPFKGGEIVAIAQAYKDFGAYCIDSRPMTNKMFVKAEYMPHQIRITNVRVERLQDISNEDCIKEGVEVVESFAMLANGEKKTLNYYRVPIFCPSGRVLSLSGSTPREVFAALINRISGKGTWENNPFVFAYDFELIK